MTRIVVAISWIVTSIATAMVTSVVIASIIAASPAMAADLPVPATTYIPAVTPLLYDWGGGYVGINGGYGFGQSQWGNDSRNPSHLTSTGNFNVNGGLAGVTVGVSGQFGAFVVGAEGDFDWQNIKGTSGSAYCTSLFTTSKATLPPATAAGLSCKTASNWVGTFRARLGYAWDRVLIYGTAGGAGANVETALNGLPYQSNPEWGWTAGAGIEVAFAEHWTFKVEYLFIDLSGNAPCNHGYSCGYDAPATTTVGAVNSNSSVKLNENIVRVGLNFKYGH